MQLNFYILLNFILKDILSFTQVRKQNLKMMEIFIFSINTLTKVTILKLLKATDVLIFNLTFYKRNALYEVTIKFLRCYITIFVNTYHTTIFARKKYTGVETLRNKWTNEHNWGMKRHINTKCSACKHKKLIYNKSFIPILFTSEMCSI